MVNFMMMIISFLANIICAFSYFEEVLKDFCIKSPYITLGTYDRCFMMVSSIIQHVLMILGN
jgi:hypothetical protein